MGPVARPLPIGCLIGSLKPDDALKIVMCSTEKEDKLPERSVGVLANPLSGVGLARGAHWLSLRRDLREV